MTRISTLRAAALASTCLLPLASFAQEAPDYNNEATLGLRYQSSNSALFGRYNGHPYDGVGAVGGFMLNGSDAWNSGKTQYFRAEGDNIDVDRHQLMPDATISVKYGQQGLWGLNAYYQGIPYWQSLTFHSLEDSSGALKGLTPRSLAVNSGVTYTALSAGPTGALTSTGATPAQLAAGTAALNGIYATMNSFNSTQAVGTQRDIVGGGASFSGVPNWTFSAGLQHEHKQGTRENALVTNTTTNILYFPEPVDYDTDRYTASAKYSTQRLQGLFSYTYSAFTDNLSSFTTPNPFNVTTLAPGYTASVYALPPSNDAHQLRGQLAYALTPSTRINGNFGYQLMEQNEANPLAYAGAPVSPYLPGAFDAKVQDLFGNVVVTARPLPRTDLRASYTIDDRKNDSSRVFVPNVAGSMITADTTGSNHAPIANLPVSQLNQTVKLEAGYAVLPSTKVSANYSYADKQRDFSVTDRNHESTLGARVISSFMDGLDGSLGYSHAVRTASAYYQNAAWLASTYPGTNAAGAQMYYLAARTRDEVVANLSWGLSSRFTAGGIVPSRVEIRSAGVTV